MDTNYFGPSGWKLLHLIAAADKRYKPFWAMLPFVLPCKFCRSSLTQYYYELPPPLTSKAPMDKWLWKIHNKVNEKLRGQGRTVAPDPPFKDVKTLYDLQLEQGCTKTYFPGWDFLFSIADNHPLSSPSRPMPDVTEQELCEIDTMTLIEKNRKNLMTPEERIDALADFWTAIPEVLPFPEWKASWNKHAGSVTKAVKNRKESLAWLWKIKCGMEKDLQQLSDTTFSGLCKKVSQHRSGCSTNKRATTCRRPRSNTKQTAPSTTRKKQG